MRLFLVMFLLSSFLYTQDFGNHPEGPNKWDEWPDRNHHQDTFNRNQKADSPFPNMRSFWENKQGVEHFNASNPFLQTQPNDEIWEAEWETDDVYAPIYPRNILSAPDSMLYVITEIEDNETLRNIRIDKTDYSGNIIWTKEYDGPIRGRDYYEYSFVSSTGELILITRYYGPDFFWVYQWVKHDSYGNLVGSHSIPYQEYVGSTKFYSNTWNNDREDNVYFAGHGSGIFIVSLDSSGIIQNWIVDKNYNVPERIILKFDRTGNIILSFKNFSYPYNGSVFQKFSKDLDLVWTTLFQSYDIGWGWGGRTVEFSIDSKNDVIILNKRRREDDPVNWESFFVKLHSSGQFISEQKLDYMSENYAQMLIDDLDNIYIFDIYGLKKYDKNMNYIWSNANIPDGSIGAIDLDCSVFIGNSSLLLKVDSLGSIVWSTKIDSGSDTKYLYFEDGNGFLITDNIQNESLEFSCSIYRFSNKGDYFHLNDLEGNSLMRDTQVFKSILSHDQSLYLIGGRGSNNDEPLHLAKVDSSGNFLWEKALMQKGPNHIHCGGLRQIAQNRLLVTWIETYGGTGGDEYFEEKFVVVNIYDLHGNLIEQHKSQFNISNGSVEYSEISDRRIHYFLRSYEEDPDQPATYNATILNHFSFDYSGNQKSNSSLITYRSGDEDKISNNIFDFTIDAEDNAFVLLRNNEEENFFLWSINRFGNVRYLPIADLSRYPLYSNGQTYSNGFNNLYIVLQLYQTTRISLIDYDGKSIKAKEYEMNQFVNGVVDSKGNLFLITYDPSSSIDKNYRLFKFNKYCKILYEKDLEDSFPSIMKILGDDILAYTGWGYSSDLYLIDANSGNTLSDFFHSDHRNMSFGPRDILTNNGDDIYLVGNKNSYQMSVLKFSDAGLQMGGEYNQAQVVLNGNYPNPYNGATRIQYTLPTAGQVDIDIYNSIGQRVDQYTGVKQAGSNNYHFKNTFLSSGIYFYSVKFNGSVKTGKMVFVK